MYISLKSKIFSDFTHLLEFLVDYEIVPAQKACQRCNLTSKLIIYTQKENQRIIYRCCAKYCSAKESLIRTSLPLTEYLHLVYFLYQMLLISSCFGSMDIRMQQ